MCKCNPFKYKVCLCSVNSIHRHNEVYHELKSKLYQYHSSSLLLWRC